MEKTYNLEEKLVLPTQQALLWGSSLSIERYGSVSSDSSDSTVIELGYFSLNDDVNQLLPEQIPVKVTEGGQPEDDYDGKVMYEENEVYEDADEPRSILAVLPVEQARYPQDEIYASISDDDIYYDIDDVMDEPRGVDGVLPIQQSTPHPVKNKDPQRKEKWEPSPVEDYMEPIRREDIPVRSAERFPLKSDDRWRPETFPEYEYADIDDVIERRQELPVHQARPYPTKARGPRPNEVVDSEDGIYEEPDEIIEKRQVLPVQQSRPSKVPRQKEAVEINSDEELYYEPDTVIERREELPVQQSRPNPTKGKYPRQEEVVETISDVAYAKPDGKRIYQNVLPTQKSKAAKPEPKRRASQMSDGRWKRSMDEPDGTDEVLN